MKKSILVVAMAALLLSSTGRATVFFNDGEEHFIYYAIGEDVRVFNSYEGNPTIVNLVPGGMLTGGIVDDDSSVFVLGGASREQLRAFHNATITVSSGSINGLSGYNDSQISLSGGEVGNYVEMSGSSRFELSGGSLDGFFHVFERAQAFVSGGIITGRIEAGVNDGFHTSVITIYGTGFNYPYGPIDIPKVYDEHYEYFYATGTLTGTLLNGDPINIGFRIYDNASIVLIPEPASLLLMGLGGLLIRKRKS